MMQAFVIPGAQQDSVELAHVPLPQNARGKVVLSLAEHC